MVPLRFRGALLADNFKGRPHARLEKGKNGRCALFALQLCDDAAPRGGVFARSALWTFGRGSRVDQLLMCAPLAPTRTHNKRSTYIHLHSPRARAEVHDRLRSSTLLAGSEIWDGRCEVEWSFRVGLRGLQPPTEQVVRAASVAATHTAPAVADTVQ